MAEYGLDNLSALYLQDPALASALRGRAAAERLRQMGGDTSPIQSPWQGVNRLIQGALGGFEEMQSDKALADLAQKQDTRRAEATASYEQKIPPSAVAGQPLQATPMSNAVAGQPAQPAPQEPGQPTQIPDALLPIFQKASAETGVPIPILAAQARQESTFRTNAVGDDGKSLGVMQVQKATAMKPGYGVAPVDPAMLHDPETNIMFGARYLAARAKAEGVTDWYDPAQRARALKAYNGGGDPNYVNHVERFIPGTGGQPAGVMSAPPGAVPQGGPQQATAPQGAAPQQPQGNDEAYYRKLRADGEYIQKVATLNSKDPDRRIAGEAQMQFQRGATMIQQSEAGLARLDARANREMKTIDLQDPTDGKNYTYENTPNGPGRKIGLAKDQPTGKQDDLAVINRLGPKVAQGTASQQEVIDYNGAATQYQTARMIQTEKGTFSIKPLLPPGMPEPQTPPWLQQPQGQAALQGGPAPQGQPAPQASNLPPGVTEFKNTERDPPQAIASGMLENTDNIRRIDDALKGVAGNPDAVGPWNYVARGPVANWWQPGGAEARAMVADIGSLKIHDRSGAAVTASESPRLAPFIPLVTDTASVVKTKLEKFAKEYRNILTDQYQVYGPASNYRALAPVENILKSQPPGGMVASPGPGGPNLDDLIAERERRKAAR